MQYGTAKFINSAGDNQVVCAGSAILHRIIVGKDVANSVIQISDSKTDGDINLVGQIEGSTLKGVYEFNMHMPNGITVDVTNQTNITVVYSPSN